jgi:hypothetical protein
MRYIPGFIPDDMTRREFEKISQALDTANERITLQVLHRAPEKFREGTIVLADGTDWNPGAGVGFYGYHSGTWNKLG